MSKTKLTYEEIVKLDNALRSVGDERKNHKFSMKVARNRFLLREHIMHVQEFNEPIPAVTALNNAKNKVFTEFARPNEAGTMKVPTEKWDEFKAKMDAVIDEHANAEKIQREFDDELKKLSKSYPLDENDNPVEFEFFQIEESLLPKDLSGNQLEGIMILIK